MRLRNDSRGTTDGGEAVGRAGHQILRRFGEESSGDLEICLARNVKELGPAIGAIAELQC